jgi:hypothetical protein
MYHPNASFVNTGGKFKIWRFFVVPGPSFQPVNADSYLKGDTDASILDGVKIVQKK